VAALGVLISLWLIEPKRDAAARPEAAAEAASQP
jgi:hypothetical protein